MCGGEESKQNDMVRGGEVCGRGGPEANSRDMRTTHEKKPLSGKGGK